MNIITPAAKPDELFSLRRVEIATIPGDFRVQISIGSFTLLNAQVEYGRLKHSSHCVIFPDNKFASLLDLDEENKSIIIEL